MVDLFLNQFIGILNLLSVLQVANIFLSSCIIAMLFSLFLSFIYVSLSSTKLYIPSIKEITFLLSITRNVLFRSSNLIYQQNLREGKLAFWGMVKCEYYLSLGHLLGLPLQYQFTWL